MKRWAWRKYKRLRSIPRGYPTPSFVRGVRRHWNVGLAAILDAAHDAFEDMLQVLRAHEDPAGGVFLPVMVAAATAADGRDAIMFAPSLHGRAGALR
jgi:hypothetical protein